MLNLNITFRLEGTFTPTLTAPSSYHDGTNNDRKHAKTLEYEIVHSMCVTTTTLVVISIVITSFTKYKI